MTPRVDRYARISVRQARYSVPARLIGQRVRVALGASELTVFAGGQEVARHARSTTKGGQVLDLDHYLEVLARKPGALPGATALARARASGTFTTEHETFWTNARRAHGDPEGTRALIEVLLLHRHLDHAAVLAGLAAANRVSATNADVVAVEARKAPRPTGPDSLTTEPAPTRILELVRSPVPLPADTRPIPSVTAYDQLLTTRQIAP